MISKVLINIGLIFISVFLVVYLILPDFFPLTNIDEAFATVVLLAILAKWGIRI